jgi:hypothetical protein
MPKHTCFLLYGYKTVDEFVPNLLPKSDFADSLVKDPSQHHNTAYPHQQIHRLLHARTSIYTPLLLHRQHMFGGLSKMIVPVALHPMIVEHKCRHCNQQGN